MNNFFQQMAETERKGRDYEINGKDKELLP